MKFIHHVPRSAVAFFLLGGAVVLTTVGVVERYTQWLKASQVFPSTSAITGHIAGTHFRPGTNNVTITAQTASGEVTLTDVVTVTATSGISPQPTSSRPPQPVVDLKANGSDGPVAVDYAASGGTRSETGTPIFTVPPGQSLLTLSWSVQNVSGDAPCRLFGGFLGSGDGSGEPVAATGSKAINRLHAQTTFRLRCGSVQDTVLVTVPYIDVDLGGFGTSHPLQIIKANTAPQVAWEGGNVQSCTGSGGLLGRSTPTGYLYNQPVTQDTTYTMTCVSGSVTVTDSVAVKVITLDLTVNGSNGPLRVTTGQIVQLSWTTANADYCTLKSIPAPHQPSGPQPVQGALASGPITGTVRFEITCFNYASAAGAGVFAYDTATVTTGTADSSPTPTPDEVGT